MEGSFLSRGILRAYLWEETKLFFGPGHALVRFDPLTGDRRTILPGSQRR